MKQITYSVNEADNFVNITIMLDQPSCVDVSVTAIPVSVNASSKIVASDMQDEMLTY